jgi:hypothetical protein
VLVIILKTVLSKAAILKEHIKHQNWKKQVRKENINYRKM